MAAALIPLIASAVTALLPMIPGIVTAVETLFPKPGSSTDKLTTATGMLSVAANQLSAAGTIQGVPDQSTLATLVQTVVTQMIADGRLTSSTTKPTAAPAAPVGTRVTFMGTLIQG